MRASLLLVALLAATVSAQEPVFALLDTSEPVAKTAMAFDDAPAFALLATTTTADCECDPCHCDPCECMTYETFLDRVKAVGAGQWVVGPIPASKVPKYAGPVYRESKRDGIKPGVYRMWVSETGKLVYKQTVAATPDRETRVIQQPTVRMWSGSGGCANGRCGR